MVAAFWSLTFPNWRRIWPGFFKINDNTALNLLDQRLQTLVQHPLCSHAVWSPWEEKARHTPIRHKRIYCGALPQRLQTHGEWMKVGKHDKPPVTSHIWVIADSSVGTLPSCSLSGVAAPGSLSTNANRRWSQRKGSLVSSLPAKGEFRGRCSYTADKNEAGEQVNKWKCKRSLVLQILTLRWLQRLNL